MNIPATTYLVRNSNKKKRKTENVKKRKTWEGLKPFTRIFKSKNLHDERAKERSKENE